MSRHVRVRVPATSANLGAGFDALGLALALYNEVEAAPARETSVTVDGEGAGRLPTGDKNVVVRAMRMVYDAAGRAPEPWAVRCVNRVPPARGLGSSAAAWVGGIAAANALLGGPLDRAAMLRLAARAEGHPDNVAAAVYGGLTVAAADAGGALAVALPVPAALVWVVLIPETTSATAEARAVLPATVTRGDAVFNVQRVALLLASLQAGRLDTLGAALDDRLHQPYRRKLFPWMGDVLHAARAAGALGGVLSGAGPSLLAVAPDARVGEAVARAMEQALVGAGVAGVARALGVDTEGVAVVEPAP
ncbi:MAG TPA: homoserine kinase [Terriglobales bacterium]|nr:homoserine kinase [Terriglobales bacterium]